MSQLITTYSLNDLEDPLSMDRDEFYENQIKIFHDTSRPTRAAEVVDLILFTPKKEMILQHRAEHKLENAGLIDTTIGAHVPYGRSPLFAIMASTLRELKIPSFVFGKNEDFEETYKLLQAYVNNSAIIQFVDSRVTNFVKTYRNESVVIANKYHLFLGVYGGPIYINKEEVAETALFSPEKLEKERSAHPEIFTKDLQFFLDEYDKKINYFLKKIPNY